MNAKILSLNIGDPELMVWNDKSVRSSMHKHPVPGPLKVHLDHIEGNSFASPNYHGTFDSVLYAYGVTSALKFMSILGLKDYTAGMTGETLTLDHFDESEISVGDVFEVGTVTAQATYPRIPCGKVNIRMKHPNGQKAMQECLASGVYFRILKPGTISSHDIIKRVEKSQHHFLISDLYKKVVYNEKLTSQELERALANDAFPKRLIEKYR